MVIMMAGGVGSKGQNLSQPDLDRGLQYLETTK
jgi:hypothetical protein